jgi:hypothetical protein
METELESLITRLRALTAAAKKYDKEDAWLDVLKGYSEDLVCYEEVLGLRMQ